MVIKKGRTQRKDATRQPLDAKERVLSPAIVNSLAKRETEVFAADQRKEAADLRKEAAGQRQEAAGQRNDTTELRHEAADQRQETADRREETADRREDTADLREEAADLRQEAADQRHDTAELRQDTADLREETADLRQEAADQRHDTAELRQDTADLREQAADKREKALRVHKKSIKAKVMLSVKKEDQLREANENLVVATVRAQNMADAAEKATVQMAYMAEHDFLTGLPNRALLTDRLAQSIAFAQRRGGKKVALMYLDLDHFKHINDSLGHEVGDHLLQSVSKRLQACFRHSDTVCRQGGDEFVVLLAEVEEVHDAVLCAKKLMESMAKPHQIGDHQLYVSLSIGISLYPDDGNDAEAVIRNADTAMYQAKRSGRNKYQIFTRDMNVRAVARQSTEVALHLALEQREFVLHYQPKVNLETGALIGAEALLRWNRSDNDQRFVRPAKFLSIAEECGLILPIGKWVLNEACRQTQAWLQAGLDPGLIAINVSSVEFHGKDFLAGVRAILTDTGLDPHHLIFELTESGLMHDTEQTTEILQTLKDLGAQIAIDDFGTGYSSLSYLWRFPIDELKIDQSFVRAINGDAGKAIVSAVIAMGASLKQRVVAEGIETRKQLAFLQSHHCAAGQGYYFGRPVAAEEFATLLETDRH